MKKPKLTIDRDNNKTYYVNKGTNSWIFTEPDIQIIERRDGDDHHIRMRPGEVADVQKIVVYVRRKKG